jgi:hypothetical protein
MQTENTITKVTRRAIIDYLSVGRYWAGNLQEHEFLGRIYDLNKMPSTDYRHEYNTAAKDIWKHRVMNSDWSDDWIFTDRRFNLLHGPDEAFLNFLAETVHPIVRPNTEEALKMAQEYNSLLVEDGWEICKVKEISGKPVFGYRRVIDGSHLHIGEAKEIADRLSGTYVAQQVRRLQEAIEKDPDLAIGTAKEFLETLCKTILTERKIEFSKSEDLPGLVKQTIKNLNVVPDDIAEMTQAKKTVTVLLNNLGSIGHQLAEVRNQFGTGHGKSSDHVGLQRRHAKLAVGTAATLAAFLYECHEMDRPEGSKSPE